MTRPSRIAGTCSAGFVDAWLKAGMTTEMTLNQLNPSEASRTGVANG
jgi:hypothetical protein